MCIRDSYATFSDYSQIIDYAKATGDQMLAMAVSNLRNDGLKWERTSSWNVEMCIRDRNENRVLWGY